MDDDDDALSGLPAYDRISIPAILIIGDDADDLSRGFIGIDDPVTIPVTIGEDANVMMGDCFTLHVTGVFVPDDSGPDDDDMPQDDDFGMQPDDDAHGVPYDEDDWTGDGSQQDPIAGDSDQ